MKQQLTSEVLKRLMFRFVAVENVGFVTKSVRSRCANGYAFIQNDFLSVREDYRLLRSYNIVVLRFVQNGHSSWKNCVIYRTKIAIMCV